jgi:hypothetical protein
MLLRNTIHVKNLQITHFDRMVMNRTMEEDRFITSDMLEYTSYPWILFHDPTLSR